jgi:hypothetical protein
VTTAAPPRGRARDGAAQVDPRLSARRQAVALHSPLLAAHSVTVRGNVHETSAQVVAAAGLSSHPPLLDVQPGTAAAGVERLPWVRSASVQVAWPDAVHITVREEVPTLAVHTAAGSWLAVSDDGRVLASSATRPPGTLLLVLPVEPGGWVQLALTSPLRIDIGSDSELPAKYEDVSAALSGATLHAGDVIDVSVPRAMTITPG